jgi:hypothetical protein
LRWISASSLFLATDAATARGRLESWFGGHRLTDAEARAFSAAVETWVDRAIGVDGGSAEANRMLARAGSIARGIDAMSLLDGSNLLPAGFAQRVRDVAAAVRLAVPAGVADPARIAAAQAALSRLGEHRGGDPARLETMRMAVRLLRWLATPDNHQPATLFEALHREVHEDGWVDRARLNIFAGDTDPQVAEALHLLYRAADAHRARHDQQFAELLAAATQSEQDPGRLIRVEDVLDQVVQPILDHGRRALLLVMDGMSVAAATELAESLTRVGTWMELTPGGGPPAGVLAALPMITDLTPADPPEPETPPTAAEPELIGKLLASNVYRQRRDPRAPLPDERVGALLRATTHCCSRPPAGGKTEAASFPILTRMAAERWTGTSVLYLCPLKALLNNLEPRLERYAGWLAAAWACGTGTSR